MVAVVEDAVVGDVEEEVLVVLVVDAVVEQAKDSFAGVKHWESRAEQILEDADDTDSVAEGMMDSQEQEEWWWWC